MAIYKITGESRSVFGNEHFSRGYRSNTRKGNERIKAGNIPEMKYRFRCCDDDGTTYFWGEINTDSSFAPLDYEGADYGCTYIEYKNPVTGKYEVL